MTTWPSDEVVTVRLSSRANRSEEQDPDRPPEERLRCGGTAQPGYVTAAAGNSVAVLGWITGRPSWWRRRHVVLDRRGPLVQPARWPGHVCPACGLVVLELPEGAPPA